MSSGFAGNSQSGDHSKTPAGPKQERAFERVENQPGLDSGVLAGHEFDVGAVDAEVVQIAVGQFRQFADRGAVQVPAAGAFDKGMNDQHWTLREVVGWRTSTGLLHCIYDNVAVHRRSKGRMQICVKCMSWIK